MTDKDLIQMLRTCPGTDCFDCEVRLVCDNFEGKLDLFIADRLEALLAENERLKAGKDMNVPTEWVSVEERLPEYVGDYLVVLDGTREMAVLFFDKWPPSWTDDNDTEYKVTHWMPTPFRPEEVE